MSSIDSKSEADRVSRLAIIKSQGASFMRTIKIQEKGKRKRVFFIRPTINGRPIYVQFRSREEAEEFLALLPPSTTNPNRKVFWDYYFTFIESIAKPNTKKAYWYAKSYLEPISKKPVDLITNDEIVNLFTQTPKSTWGHIAGILRGVADVADDPSFAHLVRKNNKKHKYVSGREDVRDPEKILNTILDYQAESFAERRARLAFLIICLTGLRVGEFLAMNEEDWEHPELLVSKTVIEEFSLSGGAARSKMSIQEETKGKKDRDVPIVAAVRKLVAEYFSLMATDGRASVHAHRKSISEPLREMARKAGLKEKVTPKTGRHIFATIFGKKCENMDEAFKLQKIMGHASFKTTEVYITSNDPSVEDIESKFDVIKKLETPSLVERAKAKAKEKTQGENPDTPRRKRGRPPKKTA